MKKEILKLFYLPIILWIILSIIYFAFIHYAINKHLNKNYAIIKQLMINEKKQNIKKEVKNFENLYFLLKKSIYSYTEFELNEFVDLLIKNKTDKFYANDMFVLGLIPKNKKLDYEIYKNRYIILNLNNKKYIVSLKNKGKKIYIFGTRKLYTDEFIMNLILKYLDRINKNNQNYIELEKIITLNPKKNEIFGYFYYMPLGLKHLEGSGISINKADMKGNYFRKKYIECFRKNKDCFLVYHWINPISKKIEKKISYFDFIKENNLSVCKGVYESQILSKLNIEFKKSKKDAFDIFKIALTVYFIVLVFFILLQHMILGKLKDKLIEQYEKMLDEIKRKNYYDNLTGIGNRNKFFDDIHNYNSLLLVDIEDFSNINDVYGFKKGDKILKYFASFFQEKYKNVYRIGSDEFAIGFKEKLNKEILKKTTKRSFEIEGIEIDIIAGASNYKEKLFESAELSLKLALKNKKEKYVLYDEKMLAEQEKKIQKINILKTVVLKKDIIPFYHCIVDKNGNIIKYESLMRIKINNKIETPFFFMDLIKEARLYSDFSRIMIEKVLKDIEKIPTKVSINLSYDDIANEEMRNFLLNSLNEDNSKKIIFEILESESIQNFEIVKDFIFKIKQKGALVAIDDFGSGYSNFVQVLNLQPDIIKIDATLIKNIKIPKYHKMIELIVDFAQSFDLKTVAEFVSDKEIFDIAKNMGIEEFQGFYFCEPQPFDKITSKKGSNEH